MNRKDLSIELHSIHEEDEDHEPVESTPKEVVDENRILVRYVVWFYLQFIL